MINAVYGLVIVAGLFSGFSSGEDSIEKLRTKALKGDSNSQATLGDIYMKGENNAPVNFPEAMKWLNMAYSNKNALAYFDIGTMVMNGSGYKKNTEKGEQYFKAAFPELLKKADGASARWKYALAMSYAMGYGTATNHEEAFKWFTKSAKEGYSCAQAKLAECYAKGIGVKMNLKEAVKWYMKAAEQGDAFSQFMVSVCYQDGEGVRQNSNESLKWLAKAAARGLSVAQYKFGLQVYLGKGVAQNREQGKKWLSSALTSARKENNKTLEAEISETISSIEVDETNAAQLRAVLEKQARKEAADKAPAKPADGNTGAALRTFDPSKENTLDEMSESLSEAKTAVFRDSIIALIAYYEKKGGNKAMSQAIKGKTVDEIITLACTGDVAAGRSDFREGCLVNLKVIDLAKQQAALVNAWKDGQQVGADEIKKIKQYLPQNEDQAFYTICPAEGEYSYNPVGTVPSCSIHGNTGSRPRSR